MNSTDFTAAGMLARQTTREITITTRLRILLLPEKLRTRRLIAGEEERLLLNAYRGNTTGPASPKTKTRRRIRIPLRELSETSRAGPFRAYASCLGPINPNRTPPFGSCLGAALNISRAISVSRASERVIFRVEGQSNCMLWPLCVLRADGEGQSPALNSHVTWLATPGRRLSHRPRGGMS
jgi:hypothetical protein